MIEILSVIVYAFVSCRLFSGLILRTSAHLDPYPPGRHRTVFLLLWTACAPTLLVLAWSILPLFISQWIVVLPMLKLTGSSLGILSLILGSPVAIQGNVPTFGESLLALWFLNATLFNVAAGIRIVADDDVDMRFARKERKAITIVSHASFSLAILTVCYVASRLAIAYLAAKFAAKT